jgi:hypothetical protein
MFWISWVVFEKFVLCKWFLTMRTLILCAGILINAGDVSTVKHGGV